MFSDEKEHFLFYLITGCSEKIQFFFIGTFKGIWVRYAQVDVIFFLDGAGQILVSFVTDGDQDVKLPVLEYFKTFRVVL